MVTDLVYLLSQLDYNSTCPFFGSTSRHSPSTKAFLGLNFGRKGGATDETAAFLQPWLLFGMISSALDVPVNYSDFVDYP